MALIHSQLLSGLVVERARLLASLSPTMQHSVDDVQSAVFTSCLLPIVPGIADHNL